MMRADLDHLPETHRHELVCAVDLLFEEFAESLRGKQAPHRKAGRILKLILFGPVRARGLERAGRGRRHGRLRHPRDRQP